MTAVLKTCLIVCFPGQVAPKGSRLSEDSWPSRSSEFATRLRAGGEEGAGGKLKGSEGYEHSRQLSGQNARPLA